MKRLNVPFINDVGKERFLKVSQNILQKVPANWPNLLFVGLIFMLISGFSVWSLSLIPEDASSLEVINTTKSQSISGTLENPLYLPYKLVSYLLLQVTDSVRSLRAVSIIIFMMCSVALFSLLNRWHSTRVAMLTLILFVTNATVLAIARLADPLIMLFAWSIMLSLLLWLIHSNSKHIAPVALAISGLALLYIPGALYVFIVLLVLFANRVRDFLKTISLRSLIITIPLMLIAFAPLVYASLQDITVLKAWLLLPESIIPADILGNILAVPSSYFYQFQIADPLITVGQLPILDIASGILLLLGTYNYYKNRVLERTKIMFLGALLAILLGALGQVRLGIAIFLPFAFILMAGGVAYLLDIWYSVFPRNPLAKHFAFIIIALVISASSIYQLKKFFVVWPNTPETVETYNQPRLIQ